MARTFLTLFCIVLIFGMLCCEMADGARRRSKRGPKRNPKAWKANKGPKCSLVLSKVPVHKKFNIDRFTGTWYTVTRTTELFGANTYESPSIEITKTADGKYTYSLTGKKGDNTCIPVETGSLELTERTGLMHMKVPGSPHGPVSMVVSFTDYKNLAMVYYCFKYKPGRQDQCRIDGIHVEILSRSENPDMKMVNNYIKRTEKRLCVKSKRLKATVPGSCKIPDILEAAKKKDIDIPKPKDGENPEKCAVHNIPVQPEFELTLMDGLWYELSRTRFTFNKLESVVTRHTYDPVDDVINSVYTGANYFPDNDTVSKCNPAILGMSKTKEGALLNGDMQGRIGGEESGYFWVPMKILYADEDYIMFYACYGVKPDGHCMQGLMEVTLVGRQPSIPTETRDSIYSILPDICVNTTDMVDTLFKTNCSDWVKEVNEIEPSDCNLDNIPVISDYDNSMLDGTWYLYKSISYTNLSLTGVVMKKKTTGREDPIRTRIYAFDPDNSSLCVEYDISARQTCLDTGDHIVSPPTGLTGNFYFSKILNVSNDMLVEYTCTMRTLDNTCEKEGVQFNVYTKDKQLLSIGDDDDNNEEDDNNDVDDDDDDKDDSVNKDEDDELDNELREALEAYKKQYDDVINELARKVCLDPKELQIETEWCYDEDQDVANMTEYEEINECDIDNHFILGDIDDFIQEHIHGYWYEIVRKKDVTHLTNEGSLVAYISSASNESLQISYTVEQADGDDIVCAEVDNTILLPRCFANSNGEYMARFRETETQVTYAPFKIVYIDDARKIMMTYVCEDVNPDGTCGTSASFIRVWARTANLSHEEIVDIYPYADWVCVDTIDENSFEVFHHNEDNSCMSNLQQYVEESLKPLAPTTVSPDGDDPEQQRDQFQDIFSLDDIERELWKSDDEFYAQ